MTEAAVNNAGEPDSVSDFEFILPWEVIETCVSLKTNGSSCFVSVNQQSNTENRLYVSKLEDNSIKIKIAIVTLETPFEESKNEVNDKEEIKDDDRLELMLQNEKSGIITLDEQNEVVKDKIEINHIDKESFTEGLSTVIIVKKIDGAIDFDNTDENYKSNKGNEMLRNNSKTENGKLNIINLLTNPEDESDILCELCFEPCENYQQLVRHIKKDHRDCTFVRNYLDEIKTLTFSHCPHCCKEFVAKSSLDAHIKVTHGGQMSKSKLSPLIQKLNVNKQELTYSRLYNTQYFANKINNTKNTISTSITIKKEPDPPVISLQRHERPVLDQSDDDNSSMELNGKQKISCDICDEAFDSRQEAMQHQNKVHRPSHKDSHATEHFKCKYCSKEFENKERLLKHCLKTHFRSIEDQPVRRKRKVGGGEEEYSDDEMAASDDDDNGSEFDDDGESEEVLKVTKSRKSEKGLKKNKKRSITSKNSKKSTKSSTKSNTSIRSSCNSSRSVSPTPSNVSAKATKGEFICNLCGADFNRMTLLVTHARYCRQKCI